MCSSDLPTRGGEEACGEPSEYGGGGHLQDAERAVGMALCVVADEDDVDGVESGGDEGENVTSIQTCKTFDGNGEEVEADDSAECAGVGPAGEMFSPENCEEEGDQHDAGAGDESGFCGRGVEEAGGLESVAAKHEKAKSCTGEEFVASDGAEGFGAECVHESGGQREAESEEEEDA